MYKSIVISDGKVLGIEFVKNKNELSIAVTGDSAGGNLTAAICCRAIFEKFKIPDGLLMAYPMLDCDMSLWRATDYHKDYNRNVTHSTMLYSKNKVSYQKNKKKSKKKKKLKTKRIYTDSIHAYMRAETHTHTHIHTHVYCCGIIHALCLLFVVFFLVFLETFLENFLKIFEKV